MKPAIVKTPRLVVWATGMCSIGWSGGLSSPAKEVIPVDALPAPLRPHALAIIENDMAQSHEISGTRAKAAEIGRERIAGWLAERQHVRPYLPRRSDDPGTVDLDRALDLETAWSVIHDAGASERELDLAAEYLAAHGHDFPMREIQRGDRHGLGLTSPEVERQREEDERRDFLTDIADDVLALVLMVVAMVGIGVLLYAWLAPVQP